MGPPWLGRGAAIGVAAPSAGQGDGVELTPKGLVAALAPPGACAFGVGSRVDCRECTAGLGAGAAASAAWRAFISCCATMYASLDGVLAGVGAGARLRRTKRTAALSTPRFFVSLPHPLWPVHSTSQALACSMLGRGIGARV